MSPLEQQLAQDRAERDAALALFQADLALVREDLQVRGVGGRLADRISDSSLDILDGAVDYAEGNKGTIAAVAAAIVVWFARGPIIRGASAVFTREEPEPEPPTLGDRLKAINPFRGSDNDG